jgi:Tfp pilus assembly protein PilF
VLALSSILLSSASAAPASPDACPPYVRTNPGGDYMNPTDRAGLGVVEEYHFTPAVRGLVRGSTGALGDDIGYVLEHFPNHHGALAAMARLAQREKTGRPKGASLTVLCYFERAVRFAPQDATVRTLYGGYLLAAGREADALEQMQAAVRLSPDDAAANYNLGLLYMRRKQYDLARDHAAKAYAAGFPLPGLKRQLQAAGHWNGE